MKRLLRHRESHQYFRDGAWSQNPHEAETFSDIVEAAQVCARYGLSDVELALRLDPGAEDVFCTPLR